MKVWLILICFYCMVLAKSVVIIEAIQDTAYFPRACGNQVEDLVTHYEIQLSKRDTLLELVIFEITKNIPRWISIDTLFPRTLKQSKNTDICIYSSPTAVVYKNGKSIETVIFIESRKITTALIPDYWNLTEERRNRQKCHNELIMRNREGRVVHLPDSDPCGYLKKLK